jgi:hypothetical protein
MFRTSLWKETDICLRCQYRFAYLPRLSKPNTKSKLVRSLTSSVQPVEPADTEEHTENGEQHVPDAQYRTASEAPIITSRRIKHLDLEKGKIPLGVQALGKPATIRIVPERIKRRKRSTIDEATSTGFESSTKASSKQDSSPSLESLLQDFKPSDSATESEVNENLEALRNTFLQKVHPIDGCTEVECQELADNIESGFRYEQLKAYIKQASRVPPVTDNLDALFVASKYRVSRWYCGNSRWPEDALQRLDPRQVPMIKDLYAIVCKDYDKDGFPQFSKKQKLINVILREYWGLRPREEKQLQGSVSMKIDAKYLEFLLGQSK